MKKSTSNAAQKAFDALEDHPSIWDAFELGAAYGLEAAAKAGEKNWPEGYVSWRDKMAVANGRIIRCGELDFGLGKYTTIDALPARRSN